MNKNRRMSAGFATMVGVMAVYIYAVCISRDLVPMWILIPLYALGLFLIMIGLELAAAEGRREILDKQDHEIHLSVNAARKMMIGLAELNPEDFKAGNRIVIRGPGEKPQLSFILDSEVQ